MARCIFLTGRPGVGKTTVVLRAVELLRSRGLKVGGMISRELREGGARVGFEIVDILTGRRGILAHVRLSGGPRVGKYTVNLKDLDEVGVAAILNAVKECDVIVIDEVGKMELFSPRFVEAVERALRSGKPVLGTVHLRATHPLARRIREGGYPDLKVIMVTLENRTKLPRLIAEELAGARA